MGEAAAEALSARLRTAGDLQELVVPIHIDGRLHAWECLTADASRLLKTDAVDHSCGHDLVGCQDVAWDIAGASIEHSLDEAERDALCEHVARVCGRSIERALVRALTPCYLAFQLGLWTQSASAADGTEAARQRRCTERYRRFAAAWIRQSGPDSGARAKPHLP